MTMFLSEHPPTRIYILIGVAIGALSMLDAVLPLTYINPLCTVVLALLLGGKTTDPVFFIGYE